MDGTVRSSPLLTDLGRHTSGNVCLYIRRLSEIDLSILDQIVQQSFDYVTSQDGHMHRAHG